MEKTTKTYVVRPGQHITHGSQEQARQHYARLPPGTPFMAYPSPPTQEYGPGDEIELTEDEAAGAAHAVMTPEEWSKESSPETLVKRGYTREEAESMVASMNEAREKRARGRGAARAKLPPLPPLPPGVNAPENAGAVLRTPIPQPEGESAPATTDERKRK